MPRGRKSRGTTTPSTRKQPVSRCCLAESRYAKSNPPPAAGGVSLPWHASARPSRETRPNASRVPRLALPHAWSFWYTPHTHPRARKHACRYAPRLAACCGARVARIGLLRVVARRATTRSLLRRAGGAYRLAASRGAYRVARIGLLRVVARIGMRAYARVVCAPQRTHAPPQGWKQARPAQGGPHPRSHRVVISVSCHEGSRLA